jgi:hypothetical protein
VQSSSHREKGWANSFATCPGHFKGNPAARKPGCTTSINTITCMDLLRWNSTTCENSCSSNQREVILLPESGTASARWKPESLRNWKASSNTGRWGGHCQVLTISRLLDPGADVLGWTTVRKADRRTRDRECFGNPHAVLVESPAQPQPAKTAAFFQGSARRLRTRPPGRKNLGGRDLGCNTRY